MTFFFTLLQFIPFSTYFIALKHFIFFLLSIHVNFDDKNLAENENENEK